MAKEFAIKLDGVTKGLRSRQYMPRNSVQTVNHMNMRCGEHGLETFEPLAEIISGSTLYTTYGVSVNSPNPQFIKGQEVIYLVDKNRLFTIDFTAGTLTEVDIYRSNQPNVITAVDAGHSWQFIDFGSAWMMVNGTASIFKMNPQTGMTRNAGDYDHVYGNNTQNINAGLEFQGRMMLGGFDSTTLTAPWRAFWSTLANKNNYDLEYEFELDANMVMWTTVGAMDMFWLFYPELMINSIVDGAGYSASDPIMLDVVRRGDAGFAVMPFKGAVKHMKRLGDSVIVYGDDGAAIMKPIVEPIPTFSITRLDIPGIMNTGAVNGDKNQHMLVDKEGYIWRVTEEGPERLDYHEYISEIDDDDVIVSYNKTLGDFYITNGARTFLLSPHGMTEVSQVIMSTVYHNGQVYGVTL